MAKAALAFGLLLALYGQPVLAQVKAAAALDRARVEAGDTLTLRVLVSGVRAAPKRVNFAAWQSQIPADNILARSDWSLSGGQWVQRFTLLVLDSATLQLPPLTVHLHLGDTLRTNPLLLTATAPPASSDVRDLDPLRDIRREPVQWYDYWAWGLLGLCLLGALAWYWHRRRRAIPVPQAVPLVPPPPSAREVALQKLAALEQGKGWLKADKILEHYAAVSLIVREFIENQYDIPALESTTREIGVLLKTTNFPDAQRPALDFLLQQADLVKYAEIQPQKKVHEQVLAKAREVVAGGA